MRLAKTTGRRRAAQRGFALPLALVAIASLAIITLAGYRAVAGATAIVTTIQDDVRIEQALYSAEAEAAFVFLTATAVNGGVQTDGASTPDVDLAFENVDVSALAPTQYWRANGQQRRSGASVAPVEVAYFDASGFAPFSVLSDEQLAQFLSAAGFDRAAAEQMAARILDFQDDDVQRRFRGAERADYRLFSAAPPTNSPLRTSGELASVLGFSDAAPPESWEFITEYARFGGLGGVFKPQLAPSGIADLFDSSDESAFATDTLESYASQDAQPTDTARFLLAYRAENGLTRRRAVEIMRTAAAADKPFRRVWIYDKVENDNGPAPAAIERRDLAPIFQPASGSDSR